jgi:outer membrane receptor for ferrienterochelin and colicins
MNKLLSFIFFFGLSSSLLSQSRILEISDAVTGKIPVSASVYFYRIGSEERTYKILTKSGKLEIPYSGSVAVKIGHIAYLSKIDTIPSGINFYKIKIQPRTYITDEIVSTGQFAPRSKQNSVYNVKVISEDIIRAKASPTLQDLLSTELNMRIDNDAVLGSSVSINGVSGQNVKIMIDGIPLVGRENGNINLDNVDMNNVERVEVIEGPMSALYGSNALGGVINVITKKKAEDGFSYRAGTYGESVGKYDANIGTSYSKKGYRVHFDVGRKFFAGWDADKNKRDLQWNPKEQYFVDLKLMKNINDIEYSFNSNLFDEYVLNRLENKFEWDSLPNGLYDYYSLDDEYKSYRLTNSLNIHGETSKNRFIDISLSHQKYQRERLVFTKNRTTLQRIQNNDPGSKSKNIFQNYLLRANYSHDDVNDELSYGVGMETNYDNAQGDKLDEESPKILDLGVYTSVEYRPTERLVLQPMLRYIYNSKFEAPLIPTLNLKYTFGRKLTARVAVSRGFRAPSLKELNFSFIDVNHYIIADENLKAETSFNSNLTLNYSAQSDGNVFGAEFKGFYNDISNMIENVQSDEKVEETIIYYVQNRSRHKTAGGDFSISYFREEASLRFGFSYIGKTSPVSDTSSSGVISESVSELFFSPEFSLNFQYYFPDIGLSFNTFYKFTGEQAGVYLQDGKVINSLISSYNMLDLSVQQKFFSDKLVFSLGVKNLLDVGDVDIIGRTSNAAHSAGGSGVGSIPLSWGRSFFTSLRLDL